MSLLKPEFLNRQNSFLGNEASRWQNGIFIWRAERWGSLQRASFKELLEIWFSESRPVDVSIMLANLLCESGGCPYLSRYEIGQHQDNPSFAQGIYFQKPEYAFECTSYGLFQPMGFWLVPNYLPQKIEKVYSVFTIDKQFDLFQAMYQECFRQARAIRSNRTLEQIVQSAIAAYAGNPRWNDYRIQRKMEVWRMIESKNASFLRHKGFSEDEIHYLFLNDKI